MANKNPETQNENIERYKYLLQPIRDIQANWESNITEYVKEYLEKVRLDRERNTQVEHGEQIKFNFAEAAMLVQSALQIYSRKVDMLHSLVAEAYNGNKRTKKRRDQGNDDSSMKDEFELLDPKPELLQNQITVARMLQLAEKRRRKEKPIGLGNRREPGRRERFVEVPISYVPTRKCVPSLHHFCFDQDDEKVFFQQNDLFSCQSMAVADREGRDLTLLLNPSYAPLLNKFTPEFIPNLRDDKNRRLSRLPHPYNLVAPAAIYQQLVALDENRDLPTGQNTVEIDDDTEDYGGDGVDDEPMEVDEGHTDTVNQPAQVDGMPIVNDSHRPSSVERVRGGADTPVDNRQSSFRAFTPMNDHLDESLRMLGSQLSARRNHLQPILVEIDVKKELELIDEYQPIKGRLRPKALEGRRKKSHIRHATDQLRVRNKLIRDRLVRTVGEENVDSVAEIKVTSYINTHILSRRVASSADILGSVNPMLLNSRIKGLNELLHLQKRYESGLQRKRDVERRAAETENRRRSSRPSREIHRNAYEESMPVDDFGQQIPTEELDGFEPIINRRRSSDGSRIANLIAAEMDVGDNDAFDDGGFPDDPDVEAVLDYNENTRETDRVLGDQVNAEAVSVDPEEFDATLRTFARGTFVERNEALFDFDDFTKFVAQNPSVMSDNDYLIHSIIKFWTVYNDYNTGSRKTLQQWRRRIGIQLAEEESHRTFDIKYYCGEIFAAFADEEGEGIGRSLKFGRIVRGCPHYELSRYFFATLVLCNCGNVEIDAARNEFGCMMMNRAKIKLLTTRLHSEIFEDQSLLTGLPAR